MNPRLSRPISPVVPLLWWSLAWLLLGACHSPPPPVVVVGGGPAGMAAAWEVAGTTPTVLLEATDRLGGILLFASGITAVPGEEYLKIWDEQAGGSNPARRRYAQQLGPLVLDWTTAMGVRWQKAQKGAAEGITLLAPTTGGAGLADTLAGAISQRGVTVTLGARVTAIKRTRQGFQVSWGEDRVQPASAVVLATGGYMGNLDMVRQRLGDTDIPLLRGSPASVDGNGFQLAASLGGREHLPAQMELYAHGIPNARIPGTAVMLLNTDEVYTISTTGEHLAQAQASRGDTGRTLLERSGGQGWAIVSKDKLQKLRFWDTEMGVFSPLPKEVQAPEFTNLEMPVLATRLGIPLEKLQAGLTPAGEQPSAAHPLKPGSRYTALRLQVTTAKGLTGMDTDLEGHLLDNTGAPIPGVYSAGELSAFGHPYDGIPLDSTMIAGAILTGRVVGQTLLADLAATPAE